MSAVKDFGVGSDVHVMSGVILGGVVGVSGTRCF